MEYRKNYITPRERIDDDMLLRIMNEEEVSGCAYGEYGKTARRQTKVGCSCAVPHTPIMPRQENNVGGGNDSENCHEACAKKNCLSGYPLAMSYTPDQEWQNLYCDDDAMSHGTIFTELYKPFYHGCCGSCR